MKRTVTLISLIALVLSASAQFKVLSNGKIAINGNGSSTYQMYCNNTDGANGIYFSASSNSTSLYGGMFSASATALAVGSKGIGNNGATSIGVVGNAYSGTKNIGLLGYVNQSNITTGAGVYGTIYGDLGSSLTTGEKYAGFFRGNVKVVGSIVTSSTIQGTLLGESSSSAVSSDGNLSLRSLSAASSLSGLHVTTYQKERPVWSEDTLAINELDGDVIKTEEIEPDIVDEQFYGKNHYALDADKLEEVFPDLVYVNKDGSKSINYMEMIPLLVQSINELSAEIEELKEQTSGRVANASSRGTTNMKAPTTRNKLFQNTPNPFNEQTTIRFSLADDSKDAAICIFDMAGKTIKKLPISSGMDSVSIGGYDIGEGMFLYSLVVNGQEIDTKKMVITK